jgi:hypothetical protein
MAKVLQPCKARTSIVYIGMQLASKCKHPTDRVRARTYYVLHHSVHLLNGNTSCSSDQKASVCAANTSI